MANKFDLTALLGDVPDLGTGRKQIEYISLDDILSDPNNRYQLSGVEELAANIEMFGLQQPLEVRPSKTHPGMYTVTSGHRRKAALELLGEDEVPCIVVEPMGSDALQELRLIFANSDTRRMTPGEQAWQAERIEALLYELKDEGYEFPGRMRDHVAAITKMSKSKLGRIKVIRDNLKQPELKKAFETGRLNESTAYEIARRDDAIQKVAETMSEELCVVTAEEATRILDGIEQDIKSPKPAPVVNANKMQPIACHPGAQPGKNEVKAYLDQRAEEDFEYRNILRELVENRFIKLPYFYGSRKNGIDGLKHLLKCSAMGTATLGYSGSPGAGLCVRRDRTAVITRSWTEAYDALCGIACDIANKALSEKEDVRETGTDPEWKTGAPNRGGKYYCKVKCEGVAVFQTLIYKEGWKLLSGGHPLDDSCTVLGWWPLPVE